MCVKNRLSTSPGVPQCDTHTVVLQKITLDESLFNSLLTSLTGSRTQR